MPELGFEFFLKAGEQHARREHSGADRVALRDGLRRVPDGVPPVDYVPLFALLGSQLTENEVIAIADELASTSDPDSAETIRTAIKSVTHEHAKEYANFVEHGYVLRRLIRRAIRHGRLAGIDGELTRPVAAAVIDRFGITYPHLARQRDQILDVLRAEERTFSRTLERGLRELQRVLAGGEPIDGATLFWLFETHGLPPEVSVEELRRQGADAGDWSTVDADGPVPR